MVDIRTHVALQRRDKQGDDKHQSAYGPNAQRSTIGETISAQSGARRNARRVDTALSISANMAAPWHLLAFGP
jgi:hypothetical protein